MNYYQKNIIASIISLFLVVLIGTPFNLEDSKVSFNLPISSVGKAFSIESCSADLSSIQKVKRTIRGLKFLRNKLTEYQESGDLGKVSEYLLKSANSSSIDISLADKKICLDDLEIIGTKVEDFISSESYMISMGDDELACVNQESGHLGTNSFYKYSENIAEYLESTISKQAKVELDIKRLTDQIQKTSEINTTTKLKRSLFNKRLKLEKFKFLAASAEMLIKIYDELCLAYSEPEIPEATPTPTVPILIPECGNGVREAGEFCDDSNKVNGDGCTSTCTVETVSKINGACGIASGETFATIPTTNLCSDGAFSNVRLAGNTYSWTCAGSNGGTTASCSASQTTTPVNGTCGSSHNVCTTGSLNDTTDNSTQYLWQCAGSYGGTSASCSDNKIIVVDDYISRAAWSIHNVSSEELTGANNAATNAIDGTTNTFWHTKWFNGQFQAAPYNISINLGATYNLTGFKYLPRSDNPNGRLAEYRIYVSTNGSTWGSPINTGNFAGSANEQEVSFSSVTGRYLRLEADADHAGAQYISIAELNIKGSLNGVSPANGICGSANGTTVSASPTTNLCSAGTVSGVANGSVYAWICAGSNGGSTASCSANKTAGIGSENGICGSANGTTVSSIPTVNLCIESDSSSVPILNNNIYTWSCIGGVGGSTANCSAIKTSRPQTFTGLIAHYDFNEGSGTSVTDKTGNYSNGILNPDPRTNQAVTFVNGVEGSKAIKLVKGNSLTLPDIIKDRQVLSFSIWAKLDDISYRGGQIINFSNHVSLKFTNNPGSRLAASYHKENQWNTLETSKTFSGTGWHHIVLVLDSNKNQQRIYVDKVISATASFTEDISYSSTLAQGNFLGRYPTADGIDLTGELDDFRVYDYVLSQNEISNLFNIGNPPPPPTPPAPKPSPVLDNNAAVKDPIVWPAGYGDATCTKSGGNTIISQHGITWTITGEKQCGNFANGEAWVVGPVSINYIYPNPTLTPVCVPDADGKTDKCTKTLHGSMINPIPNQKHGFDANAPTIPQTSYDLNLNVALSFPISLNAGDSLASSRTMNTYPKFVDTVCVLTVLDSAPPAGSFRPGPYGTDRTIRWNKSQIDYSVLKNLEHVPGSPTKQYIESILPALAWWEWGGSWADGVLAANNNLSSYRFDGASTYGREISYKWGEVGLWLNLNNSQADKERAAIRSIQSGIDIWSYITNGGNFYHDGGHKGGRKFPVFLAAVMLDDPVLRAFAKDVTIFQEDTQTFFVCGPEGGEHCLECDPNPPWRLRKDQIALLPACILNSDGKYRVNDVGKYTEPPARFFEIPTQTFLQSDIGMPEWGVRHWFDTRQDDRDPQSGYRHVVWPAMAGPVLAASLMGQEDAWGHPAIFAYNERYYSEFGFTGFVGNMWIEHKN